MARKWTAATAVTKAKATSQPGTRLPLSDRLSHESLERPVSALLADEWRLDRQRRRCLGAEAAAGGETMLAAHFWLSARPMPATGVILTSPN